METKNKLINLIYAVIGILIIVTIVHLSTTVGNLHDTTEAQQEILDSLSNQYQREMHEKDSIINFLQTTQLRKTAEMKSGIKIPQRFGKKELQIVFTECARYKLPVGVIIRLIQAESGFSYKAKSYAGAQGYMQIMPATYRAISKRIGTTNHTKYNNLKTGIYYIKHLRDLWVNKGYDNKTIWRLTILSYNYGPGRVKNNVNKFLGSQFHNYKYLVKILGKQKV